MSTAPAPPPLRLMDDDAFEALLARVSAEAAGGEEGVHGPASVYWRVSREAFLFLGAGRASMMQIAHPWVAESVASWGAVASEPVARFQRTFAAVYPAVFGTLDDALAAARGMRRVHRSARGHMSETLGPFAKGSPYYALDAHAAMWVHATLIDSSLSLYQRLIGPLSPDDRARYFREARRGGLLMGIPDDVYPDTPEAFAGYVEEMVASEVLSIGEAAQSLVASLSTGVRLGPLRIAPTLYGELTLALLPPVLRERFGFGLTARQERGAERVLAAVKRLVPLLPGSVRFVGPYHEAQARLARRRPRLMHRMSSRLLTGANKAGQSLGSR